METFTDSFPGQEDWRESKEPITLSVLERIVPNLSVSSSLEMRGKVALVKVMTNSGTGNYMSSAGTDLDWLRRKSFKQEHKGHFSVYHFKFA